MTGRTDARTHGRTERSRFRASVCRCVCASVLVACTDPRGRPVPPVVQISFGPSFRLASPGRVLGSLYMYDVDGLQDLGLSIRSADSSFVGDSLILLTGEPELTRTINWGVPAGIPLGTRVTLVARVVDSAGFATSDTARLAIQDTAAISH